MIMTTDTDLHASEFICPEMCYDVPETILSSVTSLLTISYLCELHIDIVRDDEDIFSRIEFIKIHDTCD